MVLMWAMKGFMTQREGTGVHWIEAEWKRFENRFEKML
jgi:hypothetical protein